MKKILLTILASAIVIVGMVSIQKTEASPLYLSPSSKSSTSTTTPAYITAGLATTTLTFDSNAVCTGTGNTPTCTQLGNNKLTNKATLFLQLVASSSPNTVLRINQEYSNDKIDWYQDGGTMIARSYSTTTKPYDISIVSQYVLVAASSSPGLAGNLATGATTTRAISLDIPTRYTRIIFTLAPGSAGGSVWAEIVPAKENAN